jgi:superfamily II DNA helicase RecQ
MYCRHVTLRLDPQFAAADEAYLNQLLAHAPRLTWQAAFVTGPEPYWSILVAMPEPQPAAASFTPAPGDDEPLTEEQSAVYERLRTWRYERAQADKVPVYLVAHNASLQSIARHAARILNSADLAQVKQFGQRRAAKYGAEIMLLLHGVVES